MMDGWIKKVERSVGMWIDGWMTTIYKSVYNKNILSENGFFIIGNI